MTIAPGVIVASVGWGETEEISSPARGVPTRISVAAGEGDSSGTRVTIWAKVGTVGTEASVGEGCVFVEGTCASVRGDSVAFSVGLVQAARIAIKSRIHNKKQNSLRFTSTSLYLGIPKIIDLNYF